MSNMDQIKTAVAKLSADEQAALVAWLEELAEQRFDDQIERDVRAGTLDGMAKEARANHTAGKSTRLSDRTRR